MSIKQKRKHQKTVSANSYSENSINKIVGKYEILNDNTENKLMRRVLFPVNSQISIKFSQYRSQYNKQMVPEILIRL